MKKLFFNFGLFLLLPYAAMAQEDTLLSKKCVQSINLSVFVGPISILPIEKAEHRMDLEFFFAPSLNLITRKTKHHLQYNVPSNSINVINGFFLTKNKHWDVCVSFGKQLDSHEKYLGFGLERVIEYWPIEGIVFSEIGTDLAGSKEFSLGLLVNINTANWLH